MSFTDYTSGLWLLHCSKLAMTSKNDNDVTNCQQRSSLNSFWCCHVSFLKFSYWYKFHINIITSSRVMTILLYNWLTKYLDVGNIHVLILPNIWRLAQVRNTRFVTNIYNEMLLNAAKYHVYSFYRFWVVKGKITEGGKITPYAFHFE